MKRLFSLLLWAFICPIVPAGTAGAVTSKGIRSLLAKKDGLVKEGRAITDAAAAAGRDLTDDEQGNFDAIAKQIKSTNAAIEREQLLIAEESALGAVVLADGTVQVEDNRLADPKRGFNSMGEFAKAVIGASTSRGDLDQRLLIGAAAPSTYGNEAAGADGGFLVPPAYSTELFRLMLGEDSLVPFTSNVNIDSNSMVFPKTEQTPWGSNGVRAYWQAEATAATATKPVLGTQALRLHKLMALVPLTDELMADTSALATELPGLIGDSIRWKANEAILFGNGNGQPAGALISTGPAVTQAKDTGQATNTLSVLNLFNMISRLPPGSFGRAIWLINPTVIPALATLVLGQIPVFVPAAPPANGAINMSSPNFGYILGRPCIVSQHASAFSSLGDVQLHDLSYYRTITKAGGIQTAQSLHLYFDADAVAMRATFRIDGSPKIASAISPAKGSTTLSPFVQLQAR